MSETGQEHPFPTGAALGAALLLAFVVIVVLVSQASGFGVTRMPDSAPVAQLDLRFEDRADGSVEVHLADLGQPFTVIPAGTNGFLRGTLRGLARYRKPYGEGAATPFRLTRWADGRLSLSDPVSGESVDLEVFGPANARVFAELLTAGQAAARYAEDPAAINGVQ